MTTRPAEMKEVIIIGRTKDPVFAVTGVVGAGFITGVGVSVETVEGAVGSLIKSKAAQTEVTLFGPWAG